MLIYVDIYIYIYIYIYILGTVVPPFVPDEKAVNAGHQDDIGEFNDITNIKLDKDDDAYFQKWEYVSQETSQKEIVELLQWKEVPDSKATSGGGGCCLVM